MKLKRIVCLVLCLSLAFTILGACDKQEEAKTLEETKASNISQEESKTAENATPEPTLFDIYGNMENTLEISWIGQNGAEIEDGNMVQKYIEEKFNVKLINTKADIQDSDAINLRLIDDMPDAGFMYLDAREMYDEGLTRSIPKEFIETFAPNYTNMLNEHPLGWNMHKALDKQDEYTALTGISMNLENLTVRSYFRLDWLEKLDMVPDIEIYQVDDEGRVWASDESPTFEEFDAILEAFVEDDPNSSGEDDTWGFSGWGDVDGFCWSVFEGMYGFANGYSVLYDGELYEWCISPQYKDYLKQMRDWYQRGIMDDEFITLSRSNWREKGGSGLFGYWTTTFNYLDLTATYAYNRPPLNILENDPDAKILTTAPVYGPTGLRGVRQWSPVSALNYEFYIANDVTDEELARILQIFDHINYDMDAVVFSRFGVEGETFEWLGEPYKSKPVLKEGYDLGGSTGFNYYNHPTNTDEFMPFQYGEWPNKIYDFHKGKGKELQIRPYKYDYFSETDITEVERVYGESLNTIRDEFWIRSITQADADIDAEWDDYVQTWMGAGGTEYMAELEKAPVVEDLLAGK